MTIGNYVNFVSTTLVKYQALTSKDADSLYFIEDAKKIYKGSIDVTESIKIVTSFNDIPGDDIVEGKLYLNSTTFECRVKNDGSWIIINPGYLSADDEFTDDNLNKLATVKAIKSYIDKTLPNDGSTFITVETLSDRDAIVNKVNGRIIRVNDADGNGNPKYFRWDATNRIWITETFGSVSGQIEISQVNGLTEKLESYDKSMSWILLE